MEISVKNTLLQFVAGVALLALGLFIFSQKVVVHSSFFGGFSLLGVNFTSGALVIPLIIGIVWLFVNFDSFGAKILIAVGVLIILFAVILSTQIHLTMMTLYEWILLLVLIFGGIGLVAKTLFASNHEGSGMSRTVTKTDSSVNKTSKTDIERELEELKKKR